MLKELLITLIIFVIYLCLDIFTPVSGLKSDILLGVFTAIIVMAKSSHFIIRLIIFGTLSIGSYTLVIYAQGISNIRKISGQYPSIAEKWWRGILMTDLKMVLVIIFVATLCVLIKRVYCNRQGQAD